MRKTMLFLIGFKEGIRRFGQSVSTLINSVLLSIVYFFGVGFSFIFAKLFGKHFLETKISRKKNILVKSEPEKGTYKEVLQTILVEKDVYIGNKLLLS